MIMPTSTGGLETAIDLENGASPGQTGTGFGLFAYGHRFIFETSSLPADGTVWTLRTYKGELVTDDDGRATRVVEKPRQPLSHLKGVGVYLFAPVVFDAIRRTPRICQCPLGLFACLDLGPQ